MKLETVVNTLFLSNDLVGQVISSISVLQASSRQSELVIRTAILHLWNTSISPFIYYRMGSVEKIEFLRDKLLLSSMT